MPAPSEQDLQSWISSRREVATTNLADVVMETIQEEIDSRTNPKSSPTRRNKPPVWLLASGCFLAGLGKLGLIFHLAF